MKKSVLINHKDSVATVTEEVKVNNDVIYIDREKEVIIAAKEDIPIYHKIAIKNITKGDVVYKYGEEIGLATEDIIVGSHVDVNNLKSVRA